MDVHHSHSISLLKGNELLKTLLSEVKKIEEEIENSESDDNDEPLEYRRIGKQKKKAIPERHIDLIVGCGALADQVLRGKGEALKVASRCFDLLKLGGKMVLAGLTYSLLTKEDFESLGFRVLNMTIPGSMYHDVSTDVDHQTSEVGWNGQLYLLENPNEG